MEKREKSISSALLWSALILCALSAYELLARMDAMWGPLKMFVNMAIGERIPLRRVATYVDFSIFNMPLFMLSCIVLSAFTLWLRRSVRGCAVLLVPSGALIAVGFMLRLTIFGSVVQTLKLLPLILLFLMCLARVAFAPRRKPNERVRYRRRERRYPPRHEVRYRERPRRRAS